jgi:hypothetical protein
MKLFTALLFCEILLLMSSAIPQHRIEKKRLRPISCGYYYCVCLLFYVTDGNIMYLTDASRFLISCVIQHYAPVVGWGRGGTDA